MKTVDFSETSVACDLKVGRCRQLCSELGFMDFQGKGYFLTLAQGHLYMKIKACFSQKPLGHF